MGDWKVEDGFFTGSGYGNRVRMSCHHQKGDALKACGGCYARLVYALGEIEAALNEGNVTKALQIITQVHAVQKAEGQT